MSEDLSAACFLPSCKAQNGASAAPLPSERTEFGPRQSKGMVSSSPYTRSQSRGGVRRERFAVGTFGQISLCVGSRLAAGNTPCEKEQASSGITMFMKTVGSSDHRGVVSWSLRAFNATLERDPPAWTAESSCS